MNNIDSQLLSLPWLDYRRLWKASAVFLFLVSHPAWGQSALVENRGQIGGTAQYYYDRPDIRILFNKEGITLEVPVQRSSVSTISTAKPGRSLPPATHSIRLLYRQPSRLATATGLDKLTTYHNYFTGPGPEHWFSRVPLYERLYHRNVWPGIDIIYQISDRGIAYRLSMAPGADPSQPLWDYDGAEADARQRDVTILQTSFVTIRHHPAKAQSLGRISWAPVEDESASTTTSDVESRLDASTTSLSAPKVRLQWGTFGTGGTGLVENLALDGAGNPVVVGLSRANAYISKFSADGSSLLWTTFLGGGYPTAVALDGLANVFVTGVKGPLDNLPTTPGAYDTSCNPAQSNDAFLTKLSSDGATLLASTCLGGVDDDFGADLAVTGSGEPVIFGTKGYGTDFPTTLNAYLHPCDDPRFPGFGAPGFVTKFTTDLSSLVWSTCSDLITDVNGEMKLDATGNAVLASTPDGIATVTKYGGGDGSLLWSRQLGLIDVVVSGMDIDGSGVATVVGFPLLSPPGFIVKLAVDGQVLWNRPIVGVYPFDVAVDGIGQPVVTGWTSSENFPPIVDGFDAILNNGNNTPNPRFDNFVMKFGIDGQTILWSTYLGGATTEFNWSPPVVLDGAGLPIVAGITRSVCDFPVTAGSYDPNYHPSCGDPGFDPDDFFFDTGYIVKLAGTTYCIQHDGSSGPNLAISRGVQGDCATASTTVVEQVSAVDIITGHLEFASAQSLGPVTPLACDTEQSVVEDDSKPLVGKGVFYLVRYSPDGNYVDGDGMGLQGTRTPAAGDCP